MSSQEASPYCFVKIASVTSNLDQSNDVASVSIFGILVSNDLSQPNAIGKMLNESVPFLGGNDNMLIF